MKKLITILLLSCIMLSVSACGDKAQGGGQNAPGRVNNDSGVPTEPSVQANSPALTVSFQKDGDTVVITCETPSVAAFCVAAPDASKNQFSLQFEENATGGSTLGFMVSFQYNSGDAEPMGMFHSFATDESHTTWDRDGVILFTAEGDTAKWILTGLDLSLDALDVVYIMAHTGSWENPLFAEHMGISEVKQGGEIAVSTPVGMPFEFAGEYMSQNAGEASLLIELVPGGYVLTYGNYVSQTLQPTAERQTEYDAVLFEGGLASDAPSAGENWRFIANIIQNHGHAGRMVNVTIMDVAAPTQSTRVDARLDYFYIRPGVYFYWDEESQSRKDALKIEWENKLFRFTALDKYTTEWLEPTHKENGRYDFTRVAVTDAAGQQYLLNIQLHGLWQAEYSSAYVQLFNAEQTDWMLTQTVYSEPDAGVTRNYQGTYVTAADASEPHTAVVTENSITVDNRYTLAFTFEDLVMRWRPLYLADSQNSDWHEQASFYFYEGSDGSVELQLSSYDGLLNLTAKRG